MFREERMLDVTDHRVMGMGVHEEGCRGEILRLTAAMSKERQRFHDGDESAGDRYDALSIRRRAYEMRLLWLAELRRLTTAPACR